MASQRFSATKRVYIDEIGDLTDTPPASGILFAPVGKIMDGVNLARFSNRDQFFRPINGPIAPPTPRGSFTISSGRPKKSA